ncbi:septal ring lytic transglycosylase RlpA family protein [Desulfatiglans anilini]|uniref:septal ring lytic transglycosylase RlpA family protein n=1 Tax=Desulfatiglans anilini TaxID=90728 RepID=UPI000422601C|nr:septal ring lytic transglycosylase RlpA family protein [Desulfatiglans anilini]
MEAMLSRHRIHESAESGAESRSAASRASWAVLLAVVCLFSACATRPDTVKPPGDAGPPSSVTLLPPSQRPYTINGETYYPLPSASGYMETGKASWYGHPFHGRRTSSGETYDMHKVSAAHKVLPLGTYVLVENLANGKNIVLRINDRGPFVKGRIIDLSYAAASAIDIVSPGVADVRVTALAKEVGRDRSRTGIPKPVLEPKDFSRGAFTVQAGAFKDKENAARVAERLRAWFDKVDIDVSAHPEAGTLYRVRVSQAQSLFEAQAIERRLESLGFEEAFVTAL